MATVSVPDIGDFTDVPVIEILVSEGDVVEPETPLVTLESEKATMDVPSPSAGKVTKMLVSVGDRLTEGDPICEIEESEAADAEPDADAAPDAEPDEEAEADAPPPTSADQPADSPPSSNQDKSSSELPESDKSTQVLVIGSGPGGYTAAFRAADLGLDVILVERYETIGGVCLNVGCIPSKALLHAAEVLSGAEEAAEIGISFGDPKIDIEKLRGWKDEVVGKLTGGLGGLAKRRKVEIVTGTAAFTGPHQVDVDGTTIAFEHCIVAVGSRVIQLPGFPEDERIVDSTGALELSDVPKRMLVVGGGIIGLEMATVYSALGSQVSVVELTDQLIPGCDPDLVKPLHKHVEGKYQSIMLGTKVTGVEVLKKGLKASFEGDAAPDGPQTYDRILIAVGRQANGDLLDSDAAGIEVDDRGVIPVDAQRRTNVPHIFAIGDVTGQPMLAHKATHEAVVAAEVIAGQKVAFEPRAIPSVAYTDPEVAWTGLTETEAKAEGIKVEKAVFPWQASGRALSIGRPEGLTKLLIDPESRRVLGAGIVGPSAGELIAEATLAIEMGADAEDIGLTIHAHPTLSETVGFAAEVAEGVATDIYAPKRK